MAAGKPINQMKRSLLIVGCVPAAAVVLALGVSLLHQQPLAEVIIDELEATETGDLVLKYHGQQFAPAKLENCTITNGEITSCSVSYSDGTARWLGLFGCKSTFSSKSSGNTSSPESVKFFVRVGDRIRLNGGDEVSIVEFESGMVTSGKPILDPYVNVIKLRATAMPR